VKGGNVFDCGDQPCGTPGALPASAGPRAIRFCGQNTLSLRQVDELNQVPKGTTFRRFKAHRAGLVEGRDFFRLDAGEHSTLLAALREAGLIYPSSVHLVLLTESGYRRLTEGSR
jgi:hypothetical protein